MATDANNGIEIIAHLPTNAQEVFRQIWHMASIQIAKTDDGYWMKGFSHEDLVSAAVRSLPNIQLFELKEQLLYIKGNRVPERKLPSGMLWHPIQRALKITLPSFNENLFEINGKLRIELKSTSEEQEVFASVVKLDDLLKYVDSVPNHSFNDLKWCIFDTVHAFLVGPKVLPLVSTRYWKFQDLLIPVGYDLKHSFFKQIINDFKAKSGKDEWWVINPSQAYFAIPNDHLTPLNRASVKFTALSC